MYRNLWILLMVWVPTRVNLPKDLQATGYLEEREEDYMPQFTWRRGRRTTGYTLLEGEEGGLQATG